MRVQFADLGLEKLVPQFGKLSQNNIAEMNYAGVELESRDISMLEHYISPRESPEQPANTTLKVLRISSYTLQRLDNEYNNFKLLCEYFEV